jgi:hypothetical protein
MISYQTPLIDEDREPGVAYWFPPMAPNAFSGPRAGEVAESLRAGGCPAKRDEKAVAASRFGSAVLMPHLVALEAADWKLDGLSRCTALRAASHASREAVDIVAAHLGQKPPLLFGAVRPTPMWAAVKLAPHLVPLPLETYLEYHFTKVGDQTLELMDTYLRLGRKHGLPTHAIQELVAKLPSPLGATPNSTATEAQV